MRGYAVATLHRRGNVDSASALLESLRVLEEVARRVPVLFVAHPRTAQRLSAFGLQLPGGVRLLPPEDYLDFIGLMAGAYAVVTDSGGAQEETTVLNVPCLTLRENTERPITVARGTSRLVGRSLEKTRAALSEIEEGRFAAAQPIDLWDGRAGDRIAETLLPS
jgi:UDP-N-acetylglucosamine 2-epimerase (non-hydrolysing)